MKNVLAFPIFPVSGISCRSVCKLPGQRLPRLVTAGLLALGGATTPLLALTHGPLRFLALLHIPSALLAGWIAVGGPLEADLDSFRPELARRYGTTKPRNPRHSDGIEDWTMEA